MKAALDTTKDKLRLLSAMDVDEVVDIVADIIVRLVEPQAVAVLVWDHELESFTDTFAFGSRKKDFGKFAESFGESYEDSEEPLKEVDLDEVEVKLPGELTPLYRYRLVHADRLCACLLVAGVADPDVAELADDLSAYPMAEALSRSWEIREIRRENERLRSQYEDLENQIRSMEEQTRNVIHNVVAKDALRTRSVVRESLLYEISNTARSSLKIQDVLQKSVNGIGRGLGVSHCLLLRPADGEDQFLVTEYFHPEESPVTELFHTADGITFMNTAAKKGAPQDLNDPDSDSQQVYDSAFLKRLGLKSGLIVPLILRETVVGVFFLQECRQARDWEIDDAAFLGALADHISLSIENAQLHEEREQQARMDGLTGVANRRHFNETLQLEFERARRYEQPLSLIVADLDFLKKINDTYGHKAGDDAIKTIARVFKQGSRTIDLAARYGGEEFCLLLPNTELSMAEQIAERLRRQINEEPVADVGNISASIGVASYPIHAGDPEALFLKADEALYQAKQSGRNRVCVSG